MAEFSEEPVSYLIVEAMDARRRDYDQEGRPLPTRESLRTVTIRILQNRTADGEVARRELSLESAKKLRASLDRAIEAVEGPPKGYR